MFSKYSNPIISLTHMLKDLFMCYVQLVMKSDPFTMALGITKSGRRTLTGMFKAVGAIDAELSG